MPILQRDANNNTQSIKTLNDINAGDPLPVQIAQTINATDTAVQTRLGSTNSIPAVEPTSDAGLNGVFKGYWQSFKSFLTILGTLSDAAATDGSLMARLRYIATNGTGGSGGGSTDVSGVETRLGATSETAATADTATSGLNGLIKRILSRLAIILPSLGAVDEVAATTDTASSGINGLLKRFLSRFTTYLGVIGTVADVADTTGTLMARIRATLDRVGSYGDTATPTGSLMAQLRYVGESLNRVTTITPINESLGGDRTIIAATTGKAIRITSLYYTVDNSVSITLKAGTTAISGAMPILDHAGDYPAPMPLPVDSAFVINMSAAANLRGYVIWYLV